MSHTGRVKVRTVGNKGRWQWAVYEDINVGGEQVEVLVKTGDQANRADAVAAGQAFLNSRTFGEWETP